MVVGRFRGPRHTISLGVLDHDNKNKPERIKVASLVMIRAGNLHTIVQEDSPVAAAYDTYIESVGNVRARCLDDVVKWLLKENDSPKKFEMTFIVHKGNGVMESLIEGTMLSGESVGW